MDLDQFIKNKTRKHHSRGRMFQEGVKGRMIKARMRRDIWEEIQPAGLDSAVPVIR